MSGLIWKLNRLRAMGGREIAYRVRHAAQAQWERRGLGLARPGTPAGEYGRAWLAELPSSFDTALYRTAADKVLAGRFDVFAMKDAALGFPPDWNRDPKTGTVAPLVFGKTLNYRDERIVGDIKYLWEPNRHAELVTLAQAWHLTGEEKYAEGCRTLLASWFDQCPYPLGVNWTSSLEHGVRLVNWAVAWGVIRFKMQDARCKGQDSGGEVRELDCPGVVPHAMSEWGAFERRWLDAIYRHCHFIAGHVSRHSSANNHLLGELMGLFVASVTWPCWPESARWRAWARAEFEAEALKQTAPDGVNREQAIWYHHEVADMMLLVGLIGRANGVEFGAAYWQRLERMLDFIAALMDVGGNVPMIGDADDAHMVRWVPEVSFPSSMTVTVEAKHDAHVYRSLLATGAVLFKRPDFKAKAGQLDDKSRWLLGASAVQAYSDLSAADAPLPVQRNFPDGGYYILGCDFDTPREVRIVADAAPLGYLSIAAHGHADALAFTLSAGGRELLIDPGTFAYHTQRKWRDYFKGTSAHNTVRVDGVDQSVSGGNFLWVKHTQATCERWEPGLERDVFAGSHDGYLRLKDAVLHRRELVFEKTTRKLTVTDRLECSQQHEVELFWHFSEECDICVDGRVAVVRNQDQVLTLYMPGVDWLPAVVFGSEEPPLGWISRRFDEKLPSSTLVWRGRVDGVASLVTKFELSSVVC